MSRWEETISIAAPAEQVFAYVSDFTRHGEWSGHGLKVTAGGDTPVAVGSTYSTEAKLFGTQRETSTVTDLDPPKLFAWDSKGALGVVHHWFALSDGGGATTLTKGAEFRSKKLLAKLTGKRIARDLPSALREDLAKIKAAVEGT